MSDAAAQLADEQMLMISAALGQMVATKRDLDRLHQLAVDGRMPASDDLDHTREGLARDIDALCDRLRPGTTL